MSERCFFLNKHFLAYHMQNETNNRKDGDKMQKKQYTDEEMAKLIAQKVSEFGGSTYYVGGYVRDEIIGKPNKDIDIEIHGITPQDLRNILSTFGTVKTQGESFGVFALSGYDIDIAQPRKETATGRGHRDFDVSVDPFIGCEKASERRDFTFNALMKNVLTDEIVDCHGGLDDLKNGVIRHVNDKSFIEDPLRVLRAAQFAARFHFQIAEETKDIMQQMDLSTLSSERIYGEMQKALMKSDKPSVFFNILREVGQLNPWFKELNDLIGCEQNPKYHPEGDVWNHTMNVIDNAAKCREDAKYPEFFMVSALCHDFGKPSTTKVNEKGVIQSLQHEKEGVDVIRKFLSRVNNNRELEKYVKNMCLLHMQPMRAYENNSAKKKTNAMFDKSICPEDLILLSYVDTNGKSPERTNDAEFLKWCNERVEEYNNRMKQPKVMGRDLFALGLPPSPIYSEILESAHKAHLSYVDKESVLKGIKTELIKKKLLPEEEMQKSKIAEMKKCKSVNELVENVNKNHQQEQKEKDKNKPKNKEKDEI